MDENGRFKFSQVFIVVPEEEYTNPEQQKTVAEAKKMGFKKAKIGDEITTDLPEKSEFGRIAAQTAKQVILQRLKESEKKIIFEEFSQKINTLMNGAIQQIDRQAVIINLGRVNALLLPKDQIPGEIYPFGKRIKVLVVSIEEGGREPRILVSRSRPEFVSALFFDGVPEISSGAVTIKNISREAGVRTKISVATDRSELDPIGSCVGQRGSRIQAILSELGEEKIDIILWDNDDKKYLANALSPAKVERISLMPEQKRALVLVDADQLSLAIGREGQNVRLAGRLTGWNIDLEEATDARIKEMEKIEKAKGKSPRQRRVRLGRKKKTITKKKTAVKKPQKI
ncbi:MAG: Uncharacterized protein CEN88_345 [Candidatus Berkelbacteria bacterium Licking1014_2]|uniref:Transcription termination/antitermination protein NusA n=1 Tax=Candidatus Berkelbacteria bacterium Licking1014_2 TaxID=2017146 RepID=A0A554LUC7_9BACT|nr:MAG: Uncharacterized protein CEN88_345 [Candidatus Berkelbacteria bacterium Licking1014_2]